MSDAAVQPASWEDWLADCLRELSLEAYRVELGVQTPTAVSLVFTNPPGDASPLVATISSTDEDWYAIATEPDALPRLTVNPAALRATLLGLLREALRRHGRPLPAVEQPAELAHFDG